MSKEARLESLGLANLSGAPLIEALNQKRKEIRASSSLSQLEKEMKDVAIKLELSREEERMGAYTAQPNG